VARFERAYAEFIGCEAAVAVPSGRAGLRFIFEALDLEPGAEVIFSAFGYPVVPHLARSLGCSVRFVDCEPDTLGLDPEALAGAISERTRVVVTTHLFGVPCRIREIAEITESNGAVLVEDCAHCYGASVGDRKAGAFGSFGYFSFETSKPINTMGGGMVTARDAESAARVRMLAEKEPRKDFGWLTKRLLKTTFEATVTHPWVFNLAVYPVLRTLQAGKGSGDRFASGYQPDEITMRGRMGRYTNYQARLGLSQMQAAAEQVERRARSAQRLIARLRHVVRFQTCDAPEVVSNYMLVTALFPRLRETARELLRLGVDTKHHYMRDCSGLLEDAGSFPQAAQAEREVLHLPAYPELSDRQLDRIADRVERAVKTVR
jgi:dTDP-4-amino-4,6-dideoxygalactose transaminase